MAEQQETSGETSKGSDPESLSSKEIQVQEELSYPTRLSLKEWAFVGVAALVSFAMKLSLADRRAFWLDELYTYQAVRRSVSGLIKERLSQGHSPLPFLYEKLFYDFFGDSDYALRASSALMAAVAVLATAGLAAKLRLKHLLPVLLPMLVLHPYWQVIGIEFRYMIILVAMGALWFWCYASFLERPRIATGVLSGILGGTTMWIHPSAAIIYFSILLFIILAYRLVIPKVDRSLLGWVVRLLPLALTFLTLVPLLGFLSGKPKVQEERTTTEWPSLVKEIRNQKQSYFGETRIFLSLAEVDDSNPKDVTNVFHVMMMGFLCFVFWKRKENPLAGRFLIATLVGVPLLVMFLTRFVAPAQGPARYVAFQSVAVVLAYSIIWHHALIIGWAGYGLRFLLLIFTVTFSGLHLFNEGEGNREAMAWLIEHRRPGEPLLFSTRSMNYELAERMGIDTETPFVDGIGSKEPDIKFSHQLIKANFHEGLEADVGFFMLYHSGKTPVDQAVRDMRNEGVIHDFKKWRASDKVKVIGISMNEAGTEWLIGLPPIDRPWPTSEPDPRVFEREE